MAEEQQQPAPALPSPPFVHVPGLANFRDIGGYEIAGRPGRIVRRGVVFRSSEPSKLTDEGADVLRRLGITHVYDLRSQVEVGRDGTLRGSRVREWDGARRFFVPVFLDVDYSPEALAKRMAQYASESGGGFTRAYGEMLHEATAEGHPFTPFRVILTHLARADPPPEPLLVHCTAGKDRTGITCALILGLCGVEDEVIAHEYSLTTIGLMGRRSELAGAVSSIPALKGDPAAVKRLLGSRKEAMLETLALIREKYGSVEGFVTSRCGLSPADVEQLRRNLVVDAGTGETPIDWRRHAELVPNDD